MITIISQKPNEPETTQTNLYYNKDTKTVENLGSEPISPIQTVSQKVTKQEPTSFIRTVPETTWTTNPEVSKVV